MPVMKLKGVNVLRTIVLMRKCSATILQIIVCTEDMISGSLWDAINTKQSNPEAVKVTFCVL